MSCLSRVKTGPSEVVRVLPLDKRAGVVTCASSMFVTTVRTVSSWLPHTTFGGNRSLLTGVAGEGETDDKNQ